MRQKCSSCSSSVFIRENENRNEMKSQAHENHQGMEIPFVKKIGKKAKVKVEVKVSS